MHIYIYVYICIYIYIYTHETNSSHAGVCEKTLPFAQALALAVQQQKHIWYLFYIIQIQIHI